MISIRNISSDYQKSGLNDYVLKVNYNIIGEFKHDRDDPLYVILRKAADLAEAHDKRFPWKKRKQD